MANVPNKFATDMMSYTHLSALGLLSEGAYLDYIATQPDLKGSYIMSAEASGNLIRTPTKEYKRWVDNGKPKGSFQVTSNVTGASPGASVVVTLTNASHVGSGTLSPVAEGHIYQNDADGVFYQATAVSKSVNGSHTVTLAPVDASVTASITASTAFFKHFGRMSTEEASKIKDGFYKTMSKVDREVSAIRLDKKFTDLASFEHIDINLGEGKKTIRQWNMAGMDKEFIDEQEFKLMLKPAMDNITADGLQNSGDMGLVPYIKAEGNSLIPGGVLTDSFFEDLKRIQSGNGRAKEFDILAETDAIIQWQKYLESKTGLNGAVTYGDQSGDGVRLNFDFLPQVQYLGIKLNWKEYEYFNSTRTHGADIGTGFYRGAMLFIPQGEFIAPDNTYNKLFNITYLSEPGMGTVVHTFTGGGLLGQGTEAVAEFSLLTWKSIDVPRPQEWFFAQLS